MNPFDKVTLELNRKITSLAEENAALKEQVAQLGIEFTVYKRATDLAYKGSELETQEQLTALKSKSAALKDQIEYHKGYANEYKETLDEVLANREALKEQVAQLDKYYAKRFEQMELETLSLQSKSDALVDALEMYFKQYPHMMKGYIVDALAAFKGEK